MHYNKKKVAAAIIAMAFSLGLEAQERIIHPDITYAGTLLMLRSIWFNAYSGNIF